MLKKIKVKIRRFIKLATEHFKDPAIDYVGAGIIGHMTGRVALYGGFAFSYAVIGQPVLGLLFAAVIITDVLVHIEALILLRRMMQYEVEREIAQYPFMLMQPR